MKSLEDVKLIGTSHEMQVLDDIIGSISQHTCPVLLIGETGTGKELVARSIHARSLRRRHPFVPIDCSSIVPTLIESELFGHVKGAFSGADSMKQGLFEAAGRGTVFLDEIGDLRLDLQSRLLRVLQEKEIRRLGSVERTAMNARIIAATNINLEEAMKRGLFRSDLYFRLNIVQIKLPPLRDRKNDLSALVNYFLESCSESPSSVHTISHEAMLKLISYDWPGNVRELKNAIECAMALCDGCVLNVCDFPSNIQDAPTYGFPIDNKPATWDEMVRDALLRALKESAGRKAMAAKCLGIGKTTIYRKLKRYACDS